MTNSRLPHDSADEGERTEAKHGRGTLDPGLKEQFERDAPVVRKGPSRTPGADALQRPHYEPETARGPDEITRPAASAP